MKIPNKPKRPKTAFLRYFAEVIENVKQKNPMIKKLQLYQILISKMYNKLDKKEKNLKYIAPFEKEKMIYRNKMVIYEEKYGKRIRKMIGKSPKRPLRPDKRFSKKYYCQIRKINPNLSCKIIQKKVRELYKTKDKQEELKETKNEFDKELLLYKIERKKYDKRLKEFFENDQNGNSYLKKELNSSSEILLKKRNKIKFGFSLKKIKKVKKNQFLKEKNFSEKENITPNINYSKIDEKKYPFLKEEIKKSGKFSIINSENKYEFNDEDYIREKKKINQEKYKLIKNQKKYFEELENFYKKKEKFFEEKNDLMIQEKNLIKEKKKILKLKKNINKKLEKSKKLTSEKEKIEIRENNEKSGKVYRKEKYRKNNGLSEFFYYY